MLLSQWRWATSGGVTVTLTDQNVGAPNINPNASGQVFADVVAAGHMQDFVNAVNALTPPLSTAQDLIKYANKIRNALNCAGGPFPTFRAQTVGPLPSAVRRVQTQQPLDERHG